MKNIKNNKGFTRAELLIVIAIIAALVAIMIPTFSGQIEKAREATDIANVRAAYAEVVTAYLNNDTTHMSKDVTATQKTSGWETGSTSTIGDGIDVPASASGWTVACDNTGKVTVSAKS